MNPRKAWLIAPLLLFSFGASAVEVSKERWLSVMETALPAAFCQDQMYFRQCFSVSAKECEGVASSVTRTCLAKYKDQIPRTLVQPDDGAKWGRAVGSCAGESYETILIDKRSNTAACNNPDNWIK